MHWQLSRRASFSFARAPACCSHACLPARSDHGIAQRIWQLIPTAIAVGECTLLALCLYLSRFACIQHARAVQSKPTRRSHCAVAIAGLAWCNAPHASRPQWLVLQEESGRFPHGNGTRATLVHRSDTLMSVSGSNTHALAAFVSHAHGERPAVSGE